MGPVLGLFWSGGISGLELEEVLSLWSLKNNPIDISKVWLCLFKVICQTMKRGYPQDRRKTSKFLRRKIASVPKA